MTDIEKAAAALVQARRGGQGLASLPGGWRPQGAADAYEIQRLVTAQTGPIGGWKVGAAGPDAPISCAPMPQAGIVPSPATLRAADFRGRFVESEIAFRLGRDLPAASAPYTREQIAAAIATCHPVIEVLGTRFAEPDALDPLTTLADSIVHGAFVWGAAIDNWQNLDFAALAVRQTVTGAEDRLATGNPAGDMFRLMLWLANEGALWAGGLRAGQFLTCGSWTGKSPTPDTAEVRTLYAGAPPVQVSFAAA